MTSLRKVIISSWSLLFIFLVFNIGYSENGKGANGMKLTSTAFKEGSMIPSQYSCDGEDISPALAWTDVPDGTKSFVLISDDPDAPMGTWVHWVIYNIPEEARELAEGVASDKQLLNGALQGINDFRKIGYGGPCPPGGKHRYYFKLYALDTKLNLSAGATKKEVEKAIQGHVLTQAQLMGTYQR
jgi:Raf kinase inhibitor-like YbhB/YbcL family protein